jgi:hypothetical protein
MTIREMMIRYVAEFELGGGNTVEVDMFNKISDQDLFTMFKNTVWDTAYVDGHVDGYFKGVDTEREESKKIDLKIRLN